jgi:tetratricopeptide (TPR) repeat protein
VHIPRNLLFPLMLTMFIIGFIGAYTDWLIGVILFVILIIVPSAYIIYVYYVGTSMAIQGDIHGAIRHYSRVLRLPFNKLMAYTRRAALRNAIGDIDGAIADYSAAMQLMKQEEPALYGIRSALYLGKRDYENALQDSSRLLELQPNSEIGYANRAAARMFLGDISGAIEDCNAGLDTNNSPSGKALLYNNRGTAYRLQDNYPEAMASYNLAMSAALNPNQKKMIHSAVLTNQGILYYLMDDYDNARVYFQQGLDLNAHFYKAIAGLAVARFKLGQAEKALKLWKDLTALEPRYSDAQILQQDMNLPMQMMADVNALLEVLGG